MLRVLCAIGALLIGAHAIASDLAEQALAAAREAYPMTDVRAARLSPIPGVYEFDMGGETVYGDVTARYLILGRMLDAQAAGLLSSRITARQYAAVREAAIVLQEGSGAEVIIFSDPNCPYCAQLERRILAGELAGYTVRLILVAFLPGSDAAVAGVLCAPNPAHAYRRAVLEQVQLPASCAPHAAAAHRKLAEQLGVRATPTLLAPSGRMHAGLPAGGQLAAWAQREQDAG